MADVQSTTEKAKSTDWKKRESFGSAMAQVGVVGLVLAAGVFFFYQRNATRKEVSEKLREARLTAIRNNPADLNKALAQLEEVFKLDKESPEGNALAAAIHVDLWTNHKVAGADGKARDFLAKAEKGDARTEDRYGAKALLLVSEGKDPCDFCRGTCIAAEDWERSIMPKTAISAARSRSRKFAVTSATTRVAGRASWRKRN